MGLGMKGSEKNQKKMGQGVSTSPSSSNSGDISKGAMEEESENSTNIYLKKPVFTITRQNKLSKNINVEQEEAKPCVSGSGNYSRKEKSLGELSKRFLNMFGRINECIISLDTVTKQLDVERRRVYDIINILESLGVVYRKGKNNYQWSGLDPIRETIKKLESRSADEKQDEVCEDDDSSDGENIVDQRLANKKEKSLAYLAGSFIKLFFSWKETIPLEEAAWKLSPKDIDDHKIKTKIRRLYDIANVFSSLGLIKKINLDTKKPAFKWIGINGLDEFVQELNSGACAVKKETTNVVQAKASKKRSAGKESVDTQDTLVKTEDESDLSNSPKSQNGDLLNNIFNALMTFSQQQDIYGAGNKFFAQQQQNLNTMSQFAQMYYNSKSTPVVPRTSVPIIQRQSPENLENQTTTGMNGKRAALHSVGGFEVQNTKKMNTDGVKIEN